MDRVRELSIMASPSALVTRASGSIHRALHCVSSATVSNNRVSLSSVHLGSPVATHAAPYGLSKPSTWSFNLSQLNQRAPNRQASQTTAQTCGV